MSEKRLVGMLKIMPDATVDDVTSLELIINQRWHFETELDLSTGKIEIWDTEPIDRE